MTFNTNRGALSVVFLALVYYRKKKIHLRGPLLLRLPLNTSCVHNLEEHDSNENNLLLVVKKIKFWSVGRSYALTLYHLVKIKSPFLCYNVHSSIGFMNFLALKFHPKFSVFRSYTLLSSLLPPSNPSPP